MDTENEEEGVAMSIIVYADTLLWVAAFVVFLIIELNTQNLVTLWFATGAFFDIFISLPKIASKGESSSLRHSLVPPLWQIIIFLLIAIGSFILFYPKLKKWIEKKKISTNVDSMIGKKGITVKAISPNLMGQVSIEGQIWSALAVDNQPIVEAIPVEVVAVEGVKVLVKQIK